MRGALDAATRSAAHWKQQHAEMELQVLEESEKLASLAAMQSQTLKAALQVANLRTIDLQRKLHNELKANKNLVKRNTLYENSFHQLQALLHTCASHATGNTSRRSHDGGPPSPGFETPTKRGLKSDEEVTPPTLAAPAHGKVTTVHKASTGSISASPSQHFLSDDTELSWDLVANSGDGWVDWLSQDEGSARALFAQSPAQSEPLPGLGKTQITEAR